MAARSGFARSVQLHQALDEIKREVMRGRRWVIDADIRGFFDALDPKILDLLLEERISDRRVLKLLRGWLRAGVLEGETLLRPEVGFAQGSPISPLLANVYPERARPGVGGRSRWARCARPGIAMTS